MVGLFGLFFLLTIGTYKLLTSEGFSNNDDDDEMIIRMMTKTDFCNESDVDGTRSLTLLVNRFQNYFTFASGVISVQFKTSRTFALVGANQILANSFAVMAR